MNEKQARSGKKGSSTDPSKRYRVQRSNSQSEKNVTQGMFTANKQLPSHFTVHPDWASETVSQARKK